MPGFRCGVIEYSSAEFRSFREADSSGSTVFKTFDSSLILKTVSLQEATTLLEKILPKWNPACPTSIICRVYGLFSVCIPGVSKTFAVVMNNLTQIPRPVYAVFDMKGSKFNRKVLKSPLAEMASTHSGTLKDVDFQEMIGKLSLSREDCDRLSDAVYSDVSLLNSLRVMDYSLLVAIGECPSPLSSLPTRFRRNLFQCTNAPSRVYAIGIIDFLQCYSTHKKLERLGKKSVTPQKDVSDAYSEQFLDMASSVTE